MNVVHLPSKQKQETIVTLKNVCMITRTPKKWRNHFAQRLRQSSISQFGLQTSEFRCAKYGG